eukprot:2751294-Amphidinium_carterae.1
MTNAIRTSGDKFLPEPELSSKQEEALRRLREMCPWLSHHVEIPALVRIELGAFVSNLGRNEFVDVDAPSPSVREKTCALRLFAPSKVLVYQWNGATQASLLTVMTSNCVLTGCVPSHVVKSWTALGWSPFHILPKVQRKHAIVATVTTPVIVSKCPRGTTPFHELVS